MELLLTHSNCWRPADRPDFDILIKDLKPVSGSLESLKVDFIPRTAGTGLKYGGHPNLAATNRIRTMKLFTKLKELEVLQGFIQGLSYYEPLPLPDMFPPSLEKITILYPDGEYARDLLDDLLKHHSSFPHLKTVILSYCSVHDKNCWCLHWGSPTWVLHADEPQLVVPVLSKLRNVGIAVQIVQSEMVHSILARNYEDEQ